MKQLILALLLATPALAGGIYDDTAGTATTGAANVPATLAAFPISGGTVPSGDAVTLRAEVEGVGSVQFLLNGVDVLSDPWPVTSGDAVIQLDIWRTGTTTAMVRPWIADLTDTDVLTAGGRFPVEGLAWGSSQTLSVVGRSAVAGGFTLQRAGIIK